MGGGGDSQVSETAEQVQEQKNNAALWNYYETAYKPFIDKYVSQQTSNASSPAQANKAAGQVNAEVMKAAAVPGSRQPNAVGISRQMDNVASVEATGQNNAAAKIRQREMGSIQNIVDIGRGQQTSAQQTEQQLASDSVRSAIASKEADLRSQAVTENAIGSGIGTAAAIGARGIKGSLPEGSLPDIPAADYSQFDFSKNIPMSGMVDNYGDPIGK